MVRALFRAVLLLIVVVAAAAYLLGWRTGHGPTSSTPQPVGTGGVSTERAREIGAKVGERTAVAANEARRTLSDGQVTAKIKAKMALDDSVKALAIDVDTSGSTVTVSGVVDSAAQRDRVLRLARETDGVTSVVDRLRMR
jgi:hyperosmotically inducible periplasmic protein